MRSDANTTSAAGTPTIDGLGPIGGDDHAPAEWLDLTSVVPRVALLAGLISRVCEAVHDERGRPFVEDYRELVEGIPAIVYVDRPDEYSTNFYTSPQAESLLGYTPEEWGTDQDLWLRIIHPDDVDAVKAENERSNADGEPFHAEYRIVAKDGRIVWIRDDALLVRDEQGLPRYWRGIMLDVSAEKEAEEKLRWSLDVLRRTIQQRRELAHRIETAQEVERRQIAADIHDDPVQVMSAVDVRLAMLAEQPETITTAALAELQTTVRQSIERLRSLAVRAEARGARS